MTRRWTLGGFSAAWIFVLAGCAGVAGDGTQPALSTAPPLAATTQATVRTNQIVFITEQYGMGEIAVMNADGTGRLRLTTDQRGYTSPNVWSNGQRIVYAGWTNPGYSVFVMKTDGPGRRRLTFGTGDGLTEWSPDGRRIAYRGMVDTPFGPAGRIFVMNADGSGVVQLSPDPAQGVYDFHDGPTWSPDGLRLAYRANAGLTIIGADGSNPTPIATGSYNCDNPKWSPTGTRIACVGFGNGENAIYSLRPDGTGFKVHVHGAEQLLSAAWSPDGKNLVFCRVVNATVQLFTIDLKPGGVEQPISSNAFHETYPQWVAKITVP